MTRSFSYQTGYTDGINASASGGRAWSESPSADYREGYAAGHAVHQERIYAALRTEVTA